MSQLAQTHIENLPVLLDEVPDAELWRSIGPELERPRWENSRLVRNVSQPTLTIFQPEPARAVGTGIIVCPGGAFHFLMVDKEGTAMARWLVARGSWLSCSSTAWYPRSTTTQSCCRSQPIRIGTATRWTRSGRWSSQMGFRQCAR